MDPEYVKYLRASNGDGPAATAFLSDDREVGDMSVITDNVLNWPSHFVATVGDLLPDGTVDVTSIFLGHLEGSIVMIDEFAPGYFDERYREGQTIFIKPASVWADIVAGLIGEGGGASVTISDTPPANAEPGDLWGDTSDDSVNSIVVAVGSMLFPIGQSIITTNPNNPATYYGFGTWEEDAKGRTIVGVDPSQTEFEDVGQEGGSKSHTLTESELPVVQGQLGLHGGELGSMFASRTGVFSTSTLQSGYRAPGTNYAGSQSVYHDLKFKFGSGQPHNNLQPYKTKYIWTRIG